MYPFSTSPPLQSPPQNTKHSGPLASSTNKAILEGVITAIDAVARPNGPPMPTSSQPIAVRSTSPPASLSESSAAYTDVKTSISFNGRPDLKGNVWGANGQARKSEFSWDRPGVADSSAVAVMSAGGGVDAQGVKDGVACAAMADKKSLVLAKTVANTLSGGTAHEDGRPNENGRPVASLAEEPVLSSDNKSSKLERTTSFEETDASGAKATVSIVDDPGSPPTSLAEVRTSALLIISSTAALVERFIYGDKGVDLCRNSESILVLARGCAAILQGALEHTGLRSGSRIKHPGTR